MEEEDVPQENAPAPRRSLRRAALTELNESTNEETPKRTNPDEMVIVQRGRRKKPITWSPVEYEKNKILGPPRDKTPEKSPSLKPEINSKLRRRLIMSPNRSTQSTTLGEAIARKLKSLPSNNNQTT